MRLTATFIFALALAALVGCGGGQRSSMANAANVSRSSPAQGEAARASQETSDGRAAVQNVSLQQADAAQSAPVTVERKIIRNANVSLEVEGSPAPIYVGERTVLVRYSVDTAHTEIIPHLWEDHREEMWEKLRGQFAIALWDDRKRQIQLGRDRFGIAPLFWTRQDDWLLFASEIKTSEPSCLSAAARWDSGHLPPSRPVGGIALFGDREWRCRSSISSPG